MVYKRKKLILIGIVIFLIASITVIIFTSTKHFNSHRAFTDLEYQVDVGPRIPGSVAHQKVINYIKSELEKQGWQVEVQNGYINDRSIKNIIAKRGEGKQWIILGTHYDSRIIADQDSSLENQQLPVPGANDGASSVAVLLELGRIIPKTLDKEIWLVFFDLEDQGRIEDYNWIEGSNYFVSNLEEKPDAVIIVDMVGDVDLNLYKELNSTKILTNEIWNTAASLGYQTTFIPLEKHSILDDHIPFLNVGIEAAVIIDMEYDYWHTTSDTVDKTSKKSLKIVGETLYNWLISK